MLFRITSRPEGDDDDGEDRRVLDGSDHHALDDEAPDEGDDQRAAERDPVGHARLEQRPREVGAEHRHLALGEVHHVGGLVDHDEGQREARVDAAGGEPRDDLLEKMSIVALLSTRGTSGGWRRPS